MFDGLIFSLKSPPTCQSNSLGTRWKGTGAESVGQFANSQCVGQMTPAGKALSPLSQALKAAKVGGDCCAGCSAPERSRQLTPCHHVVCMACARRARDEEESGCPVCRSHVFDDNPIFM